MIPTSLLWSPLDDLTTAILQLCVMATFTCLESMSPSCLNKILTFVAALRPKAAGSLKTPRMAAYTYQMQLRPAVETAETHWLDNTVRLLHPVGNWHCHCGQVSHQATRGKVNVLLCGNAWLQRRRRSPYVLALPKPKQTVPGSFWRLVEDIWVIVWC